MEIRNKLNKDSIYFEQWISNIVEIDSESLIDKIVINTFLKINISIVIYFKLLDYSIKVKNNSENIILNIVILNKRMIFNHLSCNFLN